MLKLKKLMHFHNGGYVTIKLEEVIVTISPVGMDPLDYRIFIREEQARNLDTRPWYRDELFGPLKVQICKELRSNPALCMISIAASEEPLPHEECPNEVYADGRYLIH